MSNFVSAPRGFPVAYRCRRPAWLYALVCLFLGATVGAARSAPPSRPGVEVIALFPGKAMVDIDGRRRTLAAGDTSPEGVTLLSATAESATFTAAGETFELKLDGRISGAFAARPEPRQLKLAPGENGHYFVDGEINGNTVRFLVDTGASIVAINKHTARRIGLLYRTDGTPGQIETASGLVPAYYLKFRLVKARTLESREVDGVVVDGDYPSVALLGQSFLNRFKMRREGVLLELEEK